MTNADGTSLHATAVAVAGSGVLIRGAAGSGKSSLALALIEDPRGDSKLVADDRVVLAAQGGALEGGYVRFAIDDQGPGIPPGKEKDIFRRFYTERPAGEKFGIHSGLGLSISKQIVEAMGGTIHAENLKHPDGRIAGARFVVRLQKAA